MALQRMLNILHHPKYEYTLGSMQDQCYGFSILFCMGFLIFMQKGSFFCLEQHGLSIVLGYTIVMQASTVGSNAGSCAPCPAATPVLQRR